MRPLHRQAIGEGVDELRQVDRRDWIAQLSAQELPQRLRLYGVPGLQGIAVGVGVVEAQPGAEQERVDLSLEVDQRMGAPKVLGEDAGAASRAGGAEHDLLHQRRRMDSAQAVESRCQRRQWLSSRRMLRSSICMRMTASEARMPARSSRLSRQDARSSSGWVGV